MVADTTATATADDRGRRSVRIARASARPAAVLLVALFAALSAVPGLGGVRHDVGPVRATLMLQPSFSGGSRVEIPPLGTLTLDTHEGPLRLTARVTGVRPAEARRLLSTDEPARALTADIADDLREAVHLLLLRSILVALAASALLSAVVFRRRQAVVLGTAATAGALLVTGALTALTARPEALAQPRFHGLLSQAPALVGSARAFNGYASGVADLTANVSKVYGALADLPTSARTRDEDIRVLWVSDLHNNPQGFRVMASLVEQFRAAAVVDAGDITDLGTEAENTFLRWVGRLGVPYVYVRGNHDSEQRTQRYLATLPNVVVLDDGAVKEVAGVRWAGTGDPLFAPTKRAPSEANVNRERLLAAGQRVAAGIADSREPVHVAVVHEPSMAEPLWGTVPLVLVGHLHERRARLRSGTLELTLGSSGGAGLRTLRGDSPLPLQMSVLHLARGTGALIAVDEVTVSGLGGRSVTIERRSPELYYDDAPAELDPDEGIVDGDEDEDEDERSEGRKR